MTFVSAGIAGYLRVRGLVEYGRNISWYLSSISGITTIKWGQILRSSILVSSLSHQASLQAQHPTTLLSPHTTPCLNNLFSPYSYSIQQPPSLPLQRYHHHVGAQLHRADCCLHFRTISLRLRTQPGRQCLLLCHVRHFMHCQCRPRHSIQDMELDGCGGHWMSCGSHWICWPTSDAGQSVF